MTDLLALADGAPAVSSDRIVLVRAGALVSVSITELATTFQAALALPRGAVLGRHSNTDGQPEALTLGPGMTIAGGELLANGEDHLGLNLLPWPDSQAEFIVNSAGRPGRTSVATMQAFFAVTAGAPGDAILDERNEAILDENGSPILG